MNFYLFDYLKELPAVDADILYYLKYELDKKIYYYGEHFKNPVEGAPWLTRRLRMALKRFLVHAAGMLRRNKRSTGGSILSNAYFTYGSELERLGFSVYSPPWNLRSPGTIYPDSGLAQAAFHIEQQFIERDYRTLIGKPFTEEVRRFKELLAGSISRKGMRALCVPNDLSFFHRISIDLFKEARLPTFLFLHGVPGRYNAVDDNTTDYLIVWGSRIKKLYIEAGVKPEKILVSGHPLYKEFQRTDLQFDIDDVLVLDKICQEGAPSMSDRVILADRGNSVTYLMILQQVLSSLGVRSVRLRVHPAGNGNWYHKFVDSSFFVLDRLPLDESLRRATLVIGPTSSVLFEAMYYGKNYLLFEPQNEGRDLANFRPVPPFDGSDARIPLARDEKELEYLLRNKIRIDSSVWNDYIQTPFSIDFMKQLV
ncbi:MAG TPA: hypothetical protein VKF36_01010 [Syntrophorhabdales bacterium]|nr:hypothetical protein [Syntrophorhabdales bacterium]